MGLLTAFAGSVLEMPPECLPRQTTLAAADSESSAALASREPETSTGFVPMFRDDQGYATRTVAGLLAGSVGLVAPTDPTRETRTAADPAVAQSSAATRKREEHQM